MSDYGKFKKKWHVLFQMAPFLAAIIILKIIAHYGNFELLSLNALFTSLIAGTIFLIGFLTTGVISDYKESEKYPSEIAASLEALHDEAHIIMANKKSKEAGEFLAFHKALCHSIIGWFYRKERTASILSKIAEMNSHFAKLEAQTQPTFMGRMKSEQGALRKIVMRIDNIRDLSFIESAYAIVEALIFFMAIGLVLMRLEPFYESLFFASVVTFLSLYMLFLIRDLDNPFDYAENGESGSEISLKPIHDLIKRL